MTVVRWPRGTPFALGVSVLGLTGLRWGIDGAAGGSFAVAALGLLVAAVDRATWRLVFDGSTLGVRRWGHWRVYRSDEVQVSFRRHAARPVPCEPDQADDLVLWGPPGLWLRLPRFVPGWSELADVLVAAGRRVERLPPASLGERAVGFAGVLAQGATGLAPLTVLVGVAGLVSWKAAENGVGALTGDLPTDAALWTAAVIGSWVGLLTAGQWLARSTQALRDPSQVGIRGLVWGMAGAMGLAAVMAPSGGSCGLSVLAMALALGSIAPLGRTGRG